jgi:hypothetical protein
MSITMDQLKKNLKKLDERVDSLCKSDAFTDGAVEPKVKQLETKAGSGQSGEVPKHTMTEGSFVDGPQKQVERALNSKAGSGAGVSEEYANITHQTGKHFNDGAVDKEEMQKCPAGKMKTKAHPGSTKGSGSKNPADKAKKAKVPNPKGGDVSGKK